MAHPSSHSNAPSANDRASYSSQSIGDRDDEQLKNSATTIDQKEIGTQGQTSTIANVESDLALHCIALRLCDDVYSTCNRTRLAMALFQ
jgi:hypothetical protein